MIVFIKGKLAGVQAAAVVLDVGGLGYKVNVPLSLLEKLPAQGSDVTLYTHLVVKEDGFSLYGFQEQNQIDYFIKLLNVSGVGPKGALAILTIFEPAELSKAILHDDIASLTRVPGVGKKTAARIILELKDKLADLDIGQETGTKFQTGEIDALEALEALGYSTVEAKKAVKEAFKQLESNPTVVDLVRGALRLLVKK